jgi:hypothetical protein
MFVSEALETLPYIRSAPCRNPNLGGAVSAWYDPAEEPGRKTLPKVHFDEIFINISQVIDAALRRIHKPFSARLRYAGVFRDGASTAACVYQHL